MNEQKNKSASPIFILGVPRSGTTLLSFLLDSHRNIAVGRETGVMQGVQHLFGDASLFSDPDIKYDYEWYKTYGVSREEYCLYIRNFLDAFFGDYARRNGKQRWAEKTPRHTKYCALIHEVFPDAQFIHLVRDPRAVCASRKAWGDSIEECAREWQEENQRVLAFAEKLPAEKCFRLRYEDLVAEPEKYARELLAFLNEPWDPNVLAHHQTIAHKYVKHDQASGIDYKAGRVYGDKPLVEGGPQNDPGRKIDTKSIDSWKRKLRKLEIKKIQEITAGGMRTYGYKEARGLIPLIGKVSV